MNRSDANRSRAHPAAAVALALIGVGLIGWLISGDVRITGGPGIGFTEMLVLAVAAVNLVLAVWRPLWVSSILLVQCSLALTFGVAEFALRLTLSQRYFTPYQLSDRYLYDLIPGAVREHRILPINGGANIYRVNSLGFRGEEFSPEPGELPRIALYGDSFIHAEYTALENTLAMQLQGRLTDQLGEPVEVINAGVAGYGPDQVLRRIEDEIGWLQPDVLVVAVFTGNDFGDLVRNKIYRPGPNGSLADNDYRFSDEIVLNARLDRSEFIVRRIVRDAAYAVLAMLRGDNGQGYDPYEMVRSALQQHIDEYQEYAVDGDNVIRTLRSDPYSADISLFPDSPSARYKLELMDAVIARIGVTAENAGVPLLIVGIPHPMDVLAGEHTSAAIDRARFPNYAAEQLTGSLQTIAERHGIPHLNLLPAFRAVSEPAALFLQAGDDHWNDAGQSYAADIVAATIAELGWLQPLPAN